MTEFKCEKCGKVFEQEASLKQHVNDKHVEKPAQQENEKLVEKPVQTSTQNEKKVSMKIGKGTLYGIIIAVVIGIGAFGGYWYFTNLPASSGAETLSTPIGPLGSTHIHADFAIFLDGEQITPLDEKYFVKNQFIHVESGSGAGTVIHMHATNVPLSFFFKSLGMNFNSECFTLDNGKEYCNEGNKTLKMYIEHQGGEWEENKQFHTYIFKDLDKILITYGDEAADEIAAQQDSVTDFAAANADRQMNLNNLPR